MSEETKKRPLISIPFLIGVVVILVGGYLAGPWLMAQYFLLQERWTTGSEAVPMGVPEGKPVLGGFGGSPDQGDAEEGGDEETREGRGPRGNFNPEEFFAERDANQDGKLSDDEIPDRMKERIANIDTDGDGAVSKEEFQAAMQRRRGGANASGDDADGEQQASEEAQADSDNASEEETSQQ